MFAKILCLKKISKLAEIKHSSTTKTNVFLVIYRKKSYVGYANINATFMSNMYPYKVYSS